MTFTYCAILVISLVLGATSAIRLPRAIRDWKSEAAKSTELKTRVDP